jgi:signal transduction histidine kinase
MRHQAPRSIGRRLAQLAMVASAAALATSTIALAVYDRWTFTEVFSRRLTWQADIVAANSASALTFDDPVAATVTVSALRAVPSTIRAAVYRADGTRFAEYHRAGALPAPDSTAIDTADGTPVFAGDSLRVTRPVLVHGKAIGMVAIDADVGELNARRRAYLLISGVILLVAIGASLIVSRRWQRRIAEPLVALQVVARDIALDQDYSRRASTTSPVTEVNGLADYFNAMLGQIEARDRSLRAAHDELELRVRARTAELEIVNRELEAFSYSVSHDLRAPLRHVSGFAELLADHAGPSLDDQSRKYIATINTAARKMATLIDDLLGFSRIGRTALNRQAVGLDRIVDAARHELMNHRPAGSPPVVWDVAALPRVDGDPALLHQVFVNLFSNAIKYSSTRPETRIEVGTITGGADEVVVYVRDNGVGFDMKYVEKLFGVFQRLHRTSEFEGTGIGLANIKRIITRHGGRVWAEAVVNQGATFYLTLPIAKERHDHDPSQDPAR